MTSTGDLVKVHDQSFDFVSGTRRVHTLKQNSNNKFELLNKFEFDGTNSTKEQLQWIEIETGNVHVWKLTGQNKSKTRTRARTVSNNNNTSPAIKAAPLSRARSVSMSSAMPTYRQPLRILQPAGQPNPLARSCTSANLDSSDVRFNPGGVRRSYKFDPDHKPKCSRGELGHFRTHHPRYGMRSHYS